MKKNEIKLFLRKIGFLEPSFLNIFPHKNDYGLKNVVLLFFAVVLVKFLWKTVKIYLVLIKSSQYAYKTDFFLT